MMALRDFIRHRLCLGFWRREEGAVLAEALLAIPFVTLFAAAILEFGSIFWQRMQIDAGLRDAGRYLSRCDRCREPMCRHVTRRLRRRSPFMERKHLRQTPNPAYLTGRTLPTSPSLLRMQTATSPFRLRISTRARRSSASSESTPSPSVPFTKRDTSDGELTGNQGILGR